MSSQPTQRLSDVDGKHCIFYIDPSKKNAKVRIVDIPTASSVPFFKALTAPSRATEYELRVGVLLVSQTAEELLVLIETTPNGALMIPNCKVDPSFLPRDLVNARLGELYGRQVSTRTIRCAVVENVPSEDVHELTLVSVARVDAPVEPIQGRAKWMSASEIEAAHDRFPADYRRILRADRFSKWARWVETLVSRTS